MNYKKIVLSLALISLSSFVMGMSSFYYGRVEKVEKVEEQTEMKILESREEKSARISQYRKNKIQQWSDKIDNFKSLGDISPTSITKNDQNAALQKNVTLNDCNQIRYLGNQNVLRKIESVSLATYIYVERSVHRPVTRFSK